jgi:hypothetical protein
MVELQSFSFSIPNIVFSTISNIVLISLAGFYLVKVNAVNSKNLGIFTKMVLKKYIKFRQKKTK